jgi:phosphomannomutase
MAAKARIPRISSPQQEPDQMPVNIDSFKAYDIRGQIPNQINADICYRIGNATAAFLDADSVVVGRDMRLSSEEFAEAVCKGLSDAPVSRCSISACVAPRWSISQRHSCRPVAVSW